MNTAYVLLVVVVFGTSPPRPTSLSHDYSSKDACEVAKQEVVSQMNTNAQLLVGSSAKVFVATCTPK